MPWRGALEEGGAVDGVEGEVRVEVDKVLIYIDQSLILSLCFGRALYVSLGTLNFTVSYFAYQHLCGI